MKNDPVFRHRRFNFRVEVRRSHSLSQVPRFLVTSYEWLCLDNSTVRRVLVSPTQYRVYYCVSVPHPDTKVRRVVVPLGFSCKGPLFFFFCEFLSFSFKRRFYSLFFARQVSFLLRRRAVCGRTSPQTYSGFGCFSFSRGR